MQLLTVAAALFATCAVAANDVVALADIQARDEFQPDPIIGLANIQARDESQPDPIVGLANIRPRDEFQPTADSLNCLYMTNDVNWAGEGQNLCNLSGYCSSGENCTGIQSLPIVHPGYVNLEAIDFNNRALSWKCWKYCGFMGSSSSAVPSSTSSGGSSSEDPNDVTHSLTVPGVPITSTAIFSAARPTSTSIVTITSTVHGPAPYTR
ncbi:hypothetical protein NU195Hw_g9294t1 [Hortaea werneckii]